MTRRTVVRLAGAALASALLLTAGAARAETPTPAKKERSAPVGAFGGSGKEPIKIDADRLDVFDRENKAVFGGNVVAVQGDSTIRCSSMTVRYRRGKDKKEEAKAASAEDGAETKSALGENGIQRVECAGPVTVVQKDQVATGDNAVFDQDAKRIVLTGNVVLSQCQNVTRGSRLVYDMNTGRANMDPVVGGRVSAMFVPQKEDGPKGAKGCPPPPAAKPTEAAAEKPAAKPRAQAN